MTTKALATEFEKRFGGRPDLIVRAPGRVNLIGDHTDYNDGLVLPIAIDRSILLAAKRTDSPSLEVESLCFDNCASIALRDPISLPEPPWARYIAGVAEMLRKKKIDVPGARLLIGGDLPAGAGLASSAALEVSAATALLHLAGAQLDAVTIANLCRRAEHEYAHSPCGIMDQLCCVLARSDHALLIDCRGQTSELLPLPFSAAALVVMDTGVRHSIAGREYAQRRGECAAATAAISQQQPKVTTLRNVAEEDLDALSKPLSDVLARRVRHVVTENARVVRGAAALRRGDLATFGRLMNESHTSLRDNFGVSCDELDRLVEIARSVPGVHGARMTGGGFGGCAIALTEAGVVDRLSSAIRANYDGEFDRDAEVFAARADNATTIVANSRQTR